MSLPPKPPDLSSAFIEAYQGHAEPNPNNLAIEEFIYLAYYKPETCWEEINKVISFNPNENATAALAAGPLEDLIHYQGDLFIERIEENARKTPAFRFLLSGVWEVGSKEIWARILKARNGVSW